MAHVTTLKSLVSDADSLLNLPRERLAFVLLQVLRDPENRQYQNKHNTLYLDNIAEGYPQAQKPRIMEALVQAWNWLEHEGLIAPRQNAERDAYQVTERGERLRTEADLEAYLQGKVGSPSEPTPQAERGSVSSAMAEKKAGQAAEPEFDVALSYAGEDRDFVEKVAAILKNRGVRVFYDRFNEVYLWGKDLGDTLDAIYRQRSRYVVIFVSKHYAQKAWPNHERKSAFARAIQEGQEYVLPARFDRTDLPGLRPTVSYIDLTRETPESFVEKILEEDSARRGTSGGQRCSEKLGGYDYRSSASRCGLRDLRGYRRRLSADLADLRGRTAKASSRGKLIL